jgi:hypothetical protein
MIENAPENAPRTADECEGDSLIEQEALERDAARYRALADAIGDERIWVYENGFREDQYIVGSLGLEALAETLIAEQEHRK